MFGFLSMPGILSAHGYDPGPTQRPLLAGAISGVIATVPAIGILIFFGALSVEARILRLSEAATVAAGCLVMAVGGAMYGWLFGRAANDVRGGWLFGMIFGFALWTAGGLMILPLASGGQAAAGEAAMGLFLSLIAWGAALGLVYPFVHHPLHESIEKAAKRTEVGPSAAAANRQRGPQRDIKPPREAPQSPRQP